MEKETLGCRLGDYIFKHHSNTSVSKEALAFQLKVFREENNSPKAGQVVRERDVTSLIPKVRAYLEEYWGVTLIYVRKTDSYKIGDALETAIYGMKVLKTTIKWAQRSGRIAPIIERKYIPGAFKKVFGPTESARKTFATSTKAFLEAWDIHRQEVKSEKDHHPKKT